MPANRRERIVRLAKATYIISRLGAAMVRFAMEAVVKSAGSNTMDETEKTIIPRDCDGREIRPLQLVQICKVPHYMVSEFQGASDDEQQIALKIQSLEGKYGFVAGPTDFADLAWHSKDNNYVFVTCKCVFRDAAGSPFVWTYQEYFPTDCLRLLPNNILLQAIFSSSTWEEAGHSWPLTAYIEKVMGLSIIELQDHHKCLVRSFMAAPP